MPEVPWTGTAVAGVPVRVLEPPHRAGGEGPAGGVVWLPDFDGLTPESLPGWTEALANRGLRMLCPTPGPTWWLDRPDPAFKAANGLTAWRWVIDELAPWAAERFGGPLAWAGAGAGGQAAIRAGFRRHGASRAKRQTPAVWAYAAAVQLEAVHGRGSTLDGLFPDGPGQGGREQARVAGVLTDLNPLARPGRLRLICPPGDLWFPGCELLAEKLRSGGVPVDTQFSPPTGGEPDDRAAALNAAGPAAAKLLADALDICGVRRAGRRAGRLWADAAVWCDGCRPRTETVRCPFCCSPPWPSLRRGRSPRSRRGRNCRRSRNRTCC